MSPENEHEIALGKERAAREKAEQIAREVSARLHQANQKLDAQVKEAVRELEQGKEDLRKSHSDLEEALKQRDSFLASMTHELRSPLHSILGLSEVLLEDAYGPLTDEQRSSLQTIHSSGTHLLDLITNVLEVARLNANQGEFELELVDVKQLCLQVVDLLATQAQKRSIEIEVDLRADSHDIWATALQTRQILVNLLSNAIKFTPEGGAIRLSTCLEPHNKTLNITFSDTGVGISQTDFHKLFKPFSQLDTGLGRGNEGSGLGLLLVQRMVDLFGGGISVDSTEGQGSSFQVSLPMAAQNKGPHHSGPTSHEVVVIDDSSLNRLIAKRILSQFSLRVHEEVDGLRGIEILRKVKPDLVLLDLYMPKLDGYDVLRLIKADPELQAIPVAVISGVDTPVNRERCLEMGADAYFTKPLESKKITAWIVERLGSEVIRSV